MRKHIKAHNIGFLTENWDVKRQLNENEETVIGKHYNMIQKTNQPISIFDFMDDWSNEGYGIALIGPDDVVIDAYIDPSDYPDMELDSSRNGATAIDSKYKGHYIMFHSGQFEDMIGKKWNAR